ARRGLRQYHELDPGGAEEARLVVDVVVAARGKGPARRARLEPPDMCLVGGRQQPALDFDRGIGRRDQDAEMSGHRDAPFWQALRSADASRHFMTMSPRFKVGGAIMGWPSVPRLC